MGINLEFENFEKEFIEFVSEFQLLSASESRLRELVRTESTRAEAAEAAKAAAERGAEDARAAATASSAAAAHAAQALAAAQDEALTMKMKLDSMERQHNLLEDKHAELVNRVAELDAEVQQLRPIQLSHCSLKRQYIELFERVNSATEDAHSECARLGNELRRVEKSASAGSELRERARLAATAHARERRLAAADLHHASKQLRIANVEISRLGCLVSELQYRLAELSDEKCKDNRLKDPDLDTLVEVRAALEAERAGAARLERALAAALADNAALASSLHASDNCDNSSKDHPTTPIIDSNRGTSVCPIDSFLEDC